MKYSVMLNITIPYEIEVEADSANEVKQIVNNMSHADILQSFAEDVMDYSNGSVEVESIIDDNGDYAYDGIGLL